MKINLEKIENSQLQQMYLKETILLSDVAVLYRHEQILWTQELGLKGMEKRPLAFFGDSPFNIISSDRDYLLVPLEEWFDFSRKILTAFKEDCDLLLNIKKRIEENLCLFEKFVDNALKNWIENKSFSIQIIDNLFELYALTDAYSILNYIIPRYCIEQQLQELEVFDLNYTIESFLISSIEPHRNMLRRKKLEIIGASKKEQSRLISEYLNNYIYYDHFTQWLYFNGKAIPEKLFLKEIKSLASIYDKQEIRSELKNMEKLRRTLLLQREEKLDKILKIGLQTDSESICNLHKQLELLSVVSYEEEKRHMIVCKFFFLMGTILNEFKIDVSRTSIEEIKKTLHYLL